MSVRPALATLQDGIELFTDGPQASRSVEVLESKASLVVPVISLLEGFKWVLHEHSEDQAIQAVEAMQRGLVVDLISTLAIAAAQLSHSLHLPMADSVILATTRANQALL